MARAFGPHDFNAAVNPGPLAQADMRRAVGAKFHAVGSTQPKQRGSKKATGGFPPAA